MVIVKSTDVVAEVSPLTLAYVVQTTNLKGFTPCSNKLKSEMEVQLVVVILAFSSQLNSRGEILRSCSIVRITSYPGSDFNPSRTVDGSHWLTLRKTLVRWLHSASITATGSL
jgi:hypothetical protein